MLFGYQLDMVPSRWLDVMESYKVCILIIIVFNLRRSVDSHLPNNTKGSAVTCIRLTENTAACAGGTSLGHGETVLVHEWQLYFPPLEGALSTKKPLK